MTIPGSPSTRHFPFASSTLGWGRARAEVPVQAQTTAGSPGLARVWVLELSGPARPLPWQRGRRRALRQDHRRAVPPDRAGCGPVHQADLRGRALSPSALHPAPGPQGRARQEVVSLLSLSGLSVAPAGRPDPCLCASLLPIIFLE